MFYRKYLLILIGLVMFSFLDKVEAKYDKLFFDLNIKNIDNKILDLVIRNPYHFAKKIPDTMEDQHQFLYKIILKLRH